MAILPILAYGINYVQQPMNHGQQVTFSTSTHIDLARIINTMLLAEHNWSSHLARLVMAADAPTSTGMPHPGLKTHYQIQQANVLARVLLSK